MSTSEGDGIFYRVHSTDFSHFGEYQALITAHEPESFTARQPLSGGQ